MDDPRESRRIAGSLREYLADALEAVRVFRWVIDEFVNRLSRRWQLGALVAQLFATVFGMLFPFALKYLVDGLVIRNYDMVVWSLGSIVTLFTLSRICSWIFFSLREYAIGEDEVQLNVRSTELFLAKSLGQHLQDSGVLSAANVEKGRHRVMEVEYVVLFDGVMTVFNVLISFIFLLVLSWFAGLVMFGLLVSYFFWATYVNRRTIAETTPLDADFRAINRYMRERWEYPERVKTNGKEEEEVRHLRTWYMDIIARDRKFWLWFIRTFNIRHLIYDILIIGPLICYAAWMVWQSAFTIGTLFPFITWVRRISDDVWRIGQVEHRMNKNMPSVRSMREALMMPCEVTDTPNAHRLSNDLPVAVELDDVCFTYPRGDGEDTNKDNPPVLSGVDFSISLGEKVALVGPSGAGKTTVMRLVQRFMDPTAGRILIDGHDLRAVRLRDWQRLIGYIPQQPQVLDGTIKYNLLYGLPAEERNKVTDEELQRVVELLKIDFGERLVDGLDTVVGRRGIKLSGGQAQRLMVGAAVLKCPRFMVIDEATSSLDSTTEKAVQDGLRKILGEDVSALIVAHRLSTVRELCSKFVVLRELQNTPAGENQIEVIGGSFEEIAQISPTFRRLAEDQGVVI